MSALLAVCAWMRPSLLVQCPRFQVKREIAPHSCTSVLGSIVRCPGPDTEKSARNSRPRNFSRPKYSILMPISSIASTPSGTMNS
ncbi:hypothetical protein D3C86_2061890 [compost metagenome]